MTSRSPSEDKDYKKRMDEALLVSSFSGLNVQDQFRTQATEKTSDSDDEDPLHSTHIAVRKNLADKGYRNAVARAVQQTRRADEASAALRIPHEPGPQSTTSTKRSFQQGEDSSDEGEGSFAKKDSQAQRKMAKTKSKDRKSRNTKADKANINDR